jgi:tRNA (guanosine-2'-O-)-methyltransferase
MLETISYRTQERTTKLETALTKRQPSLVVVLENVHDPHNIGAILRSCDAVGVMKVCMVYTIEEPPKLANTPAASGVLKWLELERFSSIGSCFDVLHREGFQILATKVDPKGKELYSYDLSVPTAIVLGNEHRGISEDATKQSDGLLYIPMMGMVESVNVSVATAVCLFEAMRQRMVSGMYDAPQLPPVAMRSTLAEWLQK